MNAPRFGPKTPYDYNHNDQFFEWLDNNYTGIMGIEFGSPPDDCVDFCISQYHRFNIPVIPETLEIVAVCASYPIEYFELQDPYGLFSGVSDVEITDDWSRFAFEILDHGNRYYEPSPETIETYRFVPGRAEEVFDSILSKPGLLALPSRYGQTIQASMKGDEWLHDVPWHMTISADARQALEELCRVGDAVDWGRMHAYAELAAWAAFAWIIGPPSRTFRMQQHDVIMGAIQWGEAILWDHSVFGPGEYRRLERAPQSCYKCGIASWCVEMTVTASGTKRICEHCLTEGMPPSKIATCGSKRCMLSQCPHHPYHHMGSAGIHQSYRDKGQLVGMTKGATKGLLNAAR